MIKSTEENIHDDIAEIAQKYINQNDDDEDSLLIGNSDKKPKEYEAPYEKTEEEKKR